MLRRTFYRFDQQNAAKKMLRVTIAGAASSGKGTISKYLIKDFGFTALSTGDELRAHVRDGTALGKDAEKFMSKGELVPDEIMIALVKEKLSAATKPEKLLLDGFPRTAAQARALNSDPSTNLHLALVLDVPDEEIIQRVVLRRVHPGSGRSYHLTFNPPKKEGVDDETGESLVQRSDDTLETVQKRLALYHSWCEPLVAALQGIETEEGFASSKHSNMADVTHVERFRGTHSPTIYEADMKPFVKRWLRDHHFE